MYEARFGLKRRPFPPTPDVSLYYPATPHEQCLAAIGRAIADDDGLALLVGEPGTGKTLLGHVLAERLGAGVTTAFLPHSNVGDRRGLLQAILFDLGLPYADDAEQGLRLRLTEFALKNASEGKRLVAIVDEAHHLSPELLEELRVLGNLEAGRKAFQAVCLAQSSIVETLKLPSLASWNQRLGLRQFLPALELAESLDYLLHRIRAAGGRPDDIFEETARDLIARAAHGVPRLLNQASHQAFLLAESNDLSRVDEECATDALVRLGIEVPEPRDSILDLKKVDPKRRSA